MLAFLESLASSTNLKCLLVEKGRSSLKQGRIESGEIEHNLLSIIHSKHFSISDWLKAQV